jgi:hypothetical protein
MGAHRQSRSIVAPAGWGGGETMQRSQEVAIMARAGLSEAA